MKLVYIAHAIGGDVEKNLADLRRIIRHINLTFPHVVPLCAYYADVVSLDDNHPLERQRGITNNMALLKSGIILELWLTGDIVSDGMKDEIKFANENNIIVVNFIGHF